MVNLRLFSNADFFNPFLEDITWTWKCQIPLNVARGKINVTYNNRGSGAS